MGGFIGLAHWITFIDAIRSNQVFAYQNYWGAPQEKYTLLVILVVATICYPFIVRKYWNKD